MDQCIRGWIEALNYYIYVWCEISLEIKKISWIVNRDHALVFSSFREKGWIMFSKVLTASFIHISILCSIIYLLIPPPHYIAHIIIKYWTYICEQQIKRKKIKEMLYYTIINQTKHGRNLAKKILQHRHTLVQLINCMHFSTIFHT